MNFIDKLNRRYASKMMNGTPVADEKIENILEAIRLAPTSLGLQAFEVFVIKNPQIRQQIYEQAATGQPQIPGCSHLLVFAAKKRISTEMLDEYISLIRRTRDFPEEKLTSFRNMMGYLEKRTDEDNFAWAARQVYIALGFALAAAAVEEVDSVPIEGFRPAEVDRILALDDKNLASVCMMAIGNRDEALDYNAKLPKVRKPKGHIFTEL